MTCSCRSRDSAFLELQVLRDGLATLRAASQGVLAWFEELKAQQHEAFDHGLAEAERNWETFQGPSLDLQPLMNAVADVEALLAPKESV